MKTQLRSVKIKFRSNLVSGIVALAFALALWFVIPAQIVDVSNKMIKADFLPRLLALIIGGCGIWLIVMSLVKPEKDKVVTFELAREGRVLIYMAVLVLYTVLFDKIGFLLSSLLLALFTLLFVREKRKLFYLIIAIYVVVLFVVFKYALGVPFPTLLLN